MKTCLLRIVFLVIFVLLQISTTFAQPLTVPSSQNHYGKIGRNLNIRNLRLRIEKFEAMCQGNYPVCPWSLDEALTDAIEGTYEKVQDIREDLAEAVKLGNQTRVRQLQLDLAKAKKAHNIALKKALLEFRQIIKKASDAWQKIMEAIRSPSTVGTTTTSSSPVPSMPSPTTPGSVSVPFTMPGTSSVPSSVPGTTTMPSSSVSLTPGTTTPANPVAPTSSGTITPGTTTPAR